MAVKKPAGPPRGSVRVEIAAAGRHVVVDSPDPLDLVAATALGMWRATDDPRGQFGFGTVATVTELGAATVPDAMALPRRLHPEESTVGKS